MTYKKRYNELIDAIKEMLEVNPHDEGLQNWVHDNVPELAESEDDKIRKALIRFHKCTIDIDGIKGDEIVSWLEKQGEQSKAKSEIVKDYIGEENTWNNAHDFRPKHLQRCLCYDKYMGGVYCYVYDDISKYWCTQTTEEHDPDGDNHISDYADYRVTVWMPLPDTSFYPSKDSIEKGIIDEIEADKNEAPSYDLSTYDKYLNWLKSIKKKIKNK